MTAAELAATEELYRSLHPSRYGGRIAHQRRIEPGSRETHDLFEMVQRAGFKLAS